MANFTHYAIAAAKQALIDAEWTAPSDREKDRTVCGLVGLWQVSCVGRC